MAQQRLRGVLSPVVTPFRKDYSPDAPRFVRHCKWLLAHGCSGLAVFGTNSEANSLSADERMTLLEQLVEGGVPAAQLMPGTGCCALTDSVRLTAHAVKLGCAGVLMLPPFYYKGVPDDGLYRNFGEVIERVGDDAAAALPLSHPAGRAGGDHARADRAAAEGLPEIGRRHEGQLGRLEQHQGDARRFREAGLRRVRRQRGLPAREHARGRRGLHHRRRERQPARHRRASTAAGSRPRPRRSRPTPTRSARSSSPRSR